MSDTTIDEDAKMARMRQEFESFMLSGKKNTSADPSSSHLESSLQSKNKKKNKKKKAKQSLGDNSTADNPRASDDDKGIDKAPPLTVLGPSTTSSAIKFCSRSGTTDKKRYFQLLRSFNNKIKHNWLHTDDQLLSIIENIVNIRARLPIEWKVLQLASSPSSSSVASSHSHQRGMHPRDDVDNCGDSNFHRQNDDRWKYCGFLGKPKEMPYSSVHLHTSDIQLALSDDVIQHEKMLVELRKHMSQLAECHDGVGRVVDTLWQFHLDCCSSMVQKDKEQDEAGVDDGVDILQIVTDVFHMLSMELYRKQKIVPLIIGSTKDELLGIREDETDFMSRSDKGVGGGDDPRGLRTARMCCKVWKRSSDETCVDVNLLAYLFNLGGEGGIEDREGQE